MDLFSLLADVRLGLILSLKLNRSFVCIWFALSSREDYQQSPTTQNGRLENQDPALNRGTGSWGTMVGPFISTKSINIAIVVHAKNIIFMSIE